MEADMTTRSDTEAHDAVCACPNDGTDPDCNYLPARLEAAWEALRDDIAKTFGWPVGQVRFALSSHRDAIEAAIRARLEVNINTLVREAHEARAAIHESRAEVALDPKRQAALERVVDDVVARHESRAGGGLDVERLAAALTEVYTQDLVFPVKGGGSYDWSLDAKLIANAYAKEAGS